MLLIGGISGSGKTTAAKAVGRQLGIPWLQVDDLRLLLQFSGLVPRETNQDLYFFLDHDLHEMRAETYRDQLIAVGEIVSRSLHVVIDHHVMTNTPLILEDDGIIPQYVAAYRAAHRENVRAVFIGEADEGVLLSNTLDRGRGFDPHANTDQQTHIHGSWLFGQWLHDEARQYQLPCIAARPYDTLPERILYAASK